MNVYQFVPVSISFPFGSEVGCGNWLYKSPISDYTVIDFFTLERPVRLKQKDTVTALGMAGFLNSSQTLIPSFSWTLCETQLIT